MVSLPDTRSGAGGFTYLYVAVQLQVEHVYLMYRKGRKDAPSMGYALAMGYAGSDHARA